MTQETPRKIILFSGHMIDREDREKPRFPSGEAARVGEEIEAQLDAWAARPGDLAIASAACGGDLLFLDACLERQLDLHVLLPFEAEAFIERSVSFAGEEWTRQFRRIVASSSARVHDAGLPQRKDARGSNPFEAINTLLIDAALAHEGSKIHLLCVWDGKNSNRPGGTDELAELANARGITITRIAPL